MQYWYIFPWISLSDGGGFSIGGLLSSSEFVVVDRYTWRWLTSAISGNLLLMVWLFCEEYFKRRSFMRERLLIRRQISRSVCRSISFGRLARSWCFFGVTGSTVWMPPPYQVVFTERRTARSEMPEACKCLRKIFRSGKKILSLETTSK